MKTIQKDELYENLSQFLKSKGIELTEGSYTKGVHAGCSMLADAINLSQAGLERARNEVEKRLDQVRQVIHESTAPRQAARSAPSAAASAPKPETARSKRQSSPKPRAQSPKGRTSRKRRK